MATDLAPDAEQRARMHAALARLPARPTALDRLLRLVVGAGFHLVGWSVRADGLERLPRDRNGRVVPCVVAVAPPPRGGWIPSRRIAPGAAWLAAAGNVPLVPIAIGGFLETGLGTRYRLRVLEPLVPPAFPPDTADGRRAARVTTESLRAALAPSVDELETWSVQANARRPLPWLRRLFH